MINEILIGVAVAGIAVSGVFMYLLVMAYKRIVDTLYDLSDTSYRHHNAILGISKYVGLHKELIEEIEENERIKPARQKADEKWKLK